MSARSRAAIVGGTLALLAGCASQPTSHADSVTQAVCRERVEAVYAKQNREQPFAQDNYATSARDAPFGTTGVTGITTRDLGDDYARREMLDDCVNSAGGGLGPTPAAPAPTAAP
jgi:hypothetical protein